MGDFRDMVSLDAYVPAVTGRLTGNVKQRINEKTPAGELEILSGGGSGHYLLSPVLSALDGSH